jgi:branched-chain amino acid transport system ATP-binding protein
VRENVQVALLSHHRRLLALLPAAGALYRDEAEALLGHVGMATLADQPVRAPAYGDLKRVELAMALANRPRLLLMDEPTAGMAPRERQDLMRLAATPRAGTASASCSPSTTWTSSSATPTACW